MDIAVNSQFVSQLIQIKSGNVLSVIIIKVVMTVRRYRLLNCRFSDNDIRFQCDGLVGD